MDSDHLAVIAAVPVKLEARFMSNAQAVKAHENIANDPSYTKGNCERCDTEVFVGQRSRVAISDPDIPTLLLCMNCAVQSNMTDVPMINLSDL